VQTLTVESRAVHRDMTVKVVLPTGDPRGRPLLVFLHGRNSDENSYLQRPLFDALKALGPRAPIVAFPDGVKDKYWHDRANGAWGTYVIRDVISHVARRFHADGRRVAIGGISMGGFGAFDLARLHPTRFCAVGGHSPALWRSGGETALERSTTLRTSPVTTWLRPPARSAAFRCGSMPATTTPSAQVSTRSPERCATPALARPSTSGLAVTTGTTGTPTGGTTCVSTLARSRAASRSSPARRSGQARLGVLAETLLRGASSSGARRGRYRNGLR
jgi:pimeloyl-ACP methyl ester carboxylesterase